MKRNQSFPDRLSAFHFLEKKRFFWLLAAAVSLALFLSNCGSGIPVPEYLDTYANTSAILIIDGVPMAFCKTLEDALNAVPVGATAEINMVGTVQTNTGHTIDGKRTITLKGGHNSALHFTGKGSLLTLEDGTLILGDGVNDLTIGGNPENDTSLIMVGEDGILEINNKVNITGNNALNGGGVYVNTNGVITMKGGAGISGNTADTGGGAFVDGGTLTMEDMAAISGNTANSYGAGVIIINSGILTMEGNAIISGNIAENVGGGVYMSTGIFTMGGNAKISGNSGTAGGGVHMTNGTFTMEDNAVISGNGTPDTNNGGGVYLTGNNEEGAGGSQFDMNGGVIGGTNPGEGNTAQEGAGVYLSGDAIITMNSGSITGNQAIDSGGGGYIGNNAKVVMNSGIITGNTAGTSGGGIYKIASGTFTQNGGTVSGNSAPSNPDVHNE